MALRVQWKSKFWFSGCYLERVIPNPIFKNSDRLCFIINMISMQNKLDKQKEIQAIPPTPVLLF